MHSIEATYGEQGLSEWAELDETFDEWFTSFSAGNAKVH